MTLDDLNSARGSVRQGDDVPPLVVDELRRACRSLIGTLPPSLSPYGTWDGDAPEDILHDWLVGKLLRDGQLLALLDRAYSVPAFRRMAERSLYHWLLASRERTQSQNLYERLAALLETDDAFVCVRAAERRQDRAYALAATPEAAPYDGSERLLQAAAWAQGELSILRYRTGSRLSPLLSTTELHRFTRGVLADVGGALTLRQLMVALGTRLDLQPTQESGATAELDVADQTAVADEVILAEAARAVVPLLTERQTAVLAGTERGDTAQAMADRLNCSAATIHNEQRRIGAVIDRFAENDAERAAILRRLAEGLVRAER